MPFAHRSKLANKKGGSIAPVHILSCAARVIARSVFQTIVPHKRTLFPRKTMSLGDKYFFIFGELASNGICAVVRVEKGDRPKPRLHTMPFPVVACYIDVTEVPLPPVRYPHKACGLASLVSLTHDWPPDIACRQSSAARLMAN